MCQYFQSFVLPYHRHISSDVNMIASLQNIDASQGNPNFWDEMFLLKVNIYFMNIWIIFIYEYL